MFRSNLIMNQRRLILLHRSFCIPRSSQQQEKCYIIKTKDEGKRVVYEKEIMKRFREQHKEVGKKSNSWDRLIQIVKELFKKGQQEAIVLIRALKIEEKLLEFQKNQREILLSCIVLLKDKLEPQKLLEIPRQIKHQYILLQASDGHKKALDIPNTILQHSKTGFVKFRHYWGIFLQSEARTKLEKCIIWMWTNGKYVVLRIIRFIREAYFDKSSDKALPKH